MKCYHCGASVDNGLALCELCQYQADRILELLPIYFRNLARWRPGRAGSRPVPGSRVLYDGSIHDPDTTGDLISDTLHATYNALTTWARDLADARPHVARLLDRLSAARADERIDEAKAVEWLSVGFRRFLTSVATLDWCGEFVRQLVEHEERLRVLTETKVPGWYAGACRLCEADTYVVPGLTWVTCGVCGTTSHAAANLDVVLSEARGWVARPKALAAALVALLDSEPSVPRLYDRIRQWSHRGDLEPIHRTARGYSWSIAEDRMVVADEDTGPARYRLGDVLDLLLPTRRLDNDGEDAAAAS